MLFIEQADDLVFHLMFQKRCGFLRATRKWRQDWILLRLFLSKDALFKLEGLPPLPISRVVAINIFLGACRIIRHERVIKLDLDVLNESLVQRSVSINLENEGKESFSKKFYVPP